MKKIFALLIAMVLSMTMLTGCGGKLPNPEDTVNSFLSEMSDGNFDNLPNYVDDSCQDELTEFAAKFDVGLMADAIVAQIGYTGAAVDESTVAPFVDALLSTMSYEIASSEVFGKEAIVSCTITVPTFAEFEDMDFVMEIMGISSEEDILELLVEVSGMTLSEIGLLTDEAKQTEIINKLTDKLINNATEYILSNAGSFEKETSEGDISLKAVNGEWKITAF